MGSWGYYDHPSEPLAGRYPSPYEEDRGWWDEMAEYESMSEFVEREMSYEEACEEIATDEGGWGVEGDSS